MKFKDCGVVGMRSLKNITVSFALFALAGCGLGPSEETRMGNARENLAAHDYRAAMIELKSVLQDNPKNSEARLLLGEAYLPLGDGASAQKELLRAQTLGVNGAKISIQLARAFLQQNKLDEALGWTNLPDGAAPDEQAQAALVRGDIQMGFRDPEKAREAYRLSLAASPQSVWSQISAVKLLLMDDALKKAANTIDQMLQQYPNNVEGWLLKGYISKGLVDHVAAEASYKNALKATGTSQYTRLGFQARLGIIQAALTQSDITDAAEQIDILLKQLPSHPLPKYFDALLAYQQKDYEKSQERLLQVLKVMEKHLPSQLLLGATQYALGQYEQASQHLTRVVNAIPSHLQARKMLAAVHMKLQSPLDAVKVLEPVVADENASAELLAMVGQAALSAGDVVNSERYLSRALQQGDSAALRSELAKLYLVKGEYDGAIKELEKISGNEALQARIMIVLAHLKKGDADSATTVMRELVAEYPEEAIVDVVSGGIYLAQGARDKARISYQQALSKDKLFVPALLGMARLDSEDGRLIEAEEFFNQVLLADSSNLRAFFGLAQIAERKNDLEQALSWIERARKSNPELLDPVLILTRYHMRLEQYGKALEIVRDGIEANPRQMVLQRLNAQIRFEQGDGAEAVEILKRVVQKSPEDASLVMALATMQRKLGRDEQARQTLSKGIQADPKLLSLEIELIELDIASSQFKAAENRIERLKKSEKNRAVGFGLEGNLKMAQEKFSDAAEAYQQALKLNSSYLFLAKMMQAKHKLGKRNEIVRDVADWLSSPENLVNESSIASIYMQLGENSQAIQHYEAINRRSPGQVTAINNLAWLYFQEGDARAISTARRAYELAPQAPEIADTLGWILYKNQQIDEGEQLLREAQKAAPNNIEIVLHLAQVLAQTPAGRQEARQLVQQLVEKSPELAQRSEVKAIRD